MNTSMYFLLHCDMFCDVMIIDRLLYTGKYAMRQLVEKLPTQNPNPNQFAVSDETICAVEAAVYQVIKANEQHARYELILQLS